MITLKQVLVIHNLAISKFGGESGLRDKALLESAINRPYQTFGSEELYPTAEEKAAALIESIVKNHPFSDGNKRTGYILMRLILLENGKDITADMEAKYQFVIAIAEGKSNFESILDWIRNHSENK